MTRNRVFDLLKSNVKLLHKVTAQQRKELFEEQKARQRAETTVQEQKLLIKKLKGELKKLKSKKDVKKKGA